MNEAKFFSGTVSSVNYEADEFKILKIRLDDQKGANVTVKGKFPGQDLSVGTWVSFEGEWVDDPKYGRQLQVLRSPATVKDWSDAKVLAALTAQNVGPMLRLALTNLGHTLCLPLADVLDKGDLRGLVGVVDTDQEFILDRWRSLRTYLDATCFMFEAGIPVSAMDRVFQVLGNDFQTVISEDPWILVRVAGVSFKEADQVAIKLGVPLASPGRVKGAVLSAVQDNVFEGHVYTTTGQIVNKVEALIPAPTPDAKAIATAIAEFCKQGTLVVDRTTKPGVVAVYDKWHHGVEVTCARLLSERINNPVNEIYLKEGLLKVSDAVREAHASGASLQVMAETALESWAAGKKLSLTQDQKEAAVRAIVSPVSLLTGLPGTGKTTTLLAVVSILQDMGTPLLLAAPTGIAAKRMTSVTGRSASTIHRAFGAKGSQKEEDEAEATYVGIVRDLNKKVTRSDETPEGQWSYGPGRPHPAQVAIIDESSMLDLHMLYRLLTSTGPNCQIVFVGDPYQLPSVGAGDVLRDLVSSGKFPHSHLDKIFRQEGTSGIVLAAHDIHAGKTPTPDQKDFVLIPVDSETEAADTIERISKTLYDRRVNFQVLSPRHAGDAGVTALNQRLRLVLNPALTGLNEIKLGASIVREGDRIMVVKNDYTMNVYNGDVGKISRIDKRAKEVVVKIHEGADRPPREMAYPFKDAAKALRLAYAQTVHKSQGQEYDVIVIPVLSAFGRQLQRNLLYTGCTRAKQKVFLIGSVQALEKAVANNRADERNSMLTQRIKINLGGPNSGT